MASQIEQTVASLTALSDQYSTQLQRVFKKNDDWFQAFRSSTLLNFKSALQKIESRSAQHRSPVKPLRKKVRRKGRKAIRVRKNKNRSVPRSPFISTAGQSVHDTSIRTKSILVSSPLRQHCISERSGTEVEAPRSNLPSLPSLPQHQVSESPQEKSEEKADREAESDKQYSSAIKKKHSDRASRSTGSFHSAVDAGNLPQSPPNEGTQWEDCRSKPESVGVEPTNHATKRQQPELEGSDSAEGIPETSNHGVKHNAIPKSQASRTDQDLDQIDEVAGIVDLEEVTEGTPEPLIEDIQNEEPCESRSVGIGTSYRSPEGGPSPASNPVDTSDLNLNQSERCDEDGFSTDVPCTALFAALQRKRKAEGPENSADKRNERHGSEPQESEEDPELDTVLRKDLSLTTEDQFEFKAPKPKSILTGQTAEATFDLQPPVHQTPTQPFKRDSRTIEKKQTFFQKHFAVDEGGKINDTGIGLLSEIASTPATASKGNEPDALNRLEEGRLRGTKLFKPNNDIYSSQRKPVLSRVLSLQKSNLTTRGSLLSHTPGAHAPSTRLARDSTLSGLLTSNLRESLAALKQPITDRNPTPAIEDGQPLRDSTQGSQEPVLPRAKEQKSLDVPVGKRLTFADDYKRQFEGRLPQFSRGSEPQTAPTKEFRQPRIRRDTKQSALRRRIEEIRGITSSLSVTNQPSPRPSSSNSIPDNLPGQAKGSDPSNAARTDPAVEMGSDALERDRKISGMSKTSAEVETVATKMSFENTPNAVELRDSVTSNGAGDWYGENHETDSPPKEKKGEWHANAGREGAENYSGETEEENQKETAKKEELGVAQENHAPKNILSNLMTSASSLYTGLSILGTRTQEDKRGDSDGEQAAKRQRMDAERREVERLARMEAQRAARQREAEEKQRRAEARRQLLAEAEKAKEEERKRKEMHRKRVKQQEEEERKRKKIEDDKKKEERRRQVLEKRAMNLELQGKRKPMDGKRQRVLKTGDRGMSSIPKPNGVGVKSGKGYGGGKHLGGYGCSGMRDEEEREMNSYDMTPAKATVIEESDEETERRKGKTIPEWAGERNLAISARSQPDPDKVFVNMPMCNLRDVFGNQKQYRTRSSSANWTQDRVTSSEMTRYKKAVGGFRDA